MVALGVLTLGGCAADGTYVAGSPPPPATEMIAISVGPCFGFCPVYRTQIAPTGTVTFEGERHTAALGAREHKCSRSLYDAVARDLAPFRPSDGETARVDCEAAITDTSSYTITWTAPDGRKTVATHRRGCSGGPGHGLDAVLNELPARLGVEAWAKQVTRPGTSRG